MDRVESHVRLRRIHRNKNRGRVAAVAAATTVSRTLGARRRSETEKKKENRKIKIRTVRVIPKAEGCGVECRRRSHMHKKDGSASEQPCDDEQRGE
jgi:hypothetical protein